MAEIVAAELVQPATPSASCVGTRVDHAPLRELLAAVLAAVLCDLTLYRGEGFAGLALLFLLAPALLLLGCSAPRLNRGLGIVAGMILLLSVRLVWLGSVLGVVAGFFLIVASAMCLAGQRPYVLDMLAYALQTSFAGGRGLVCHARAMSQPGRRLPRLFWLNVGLPLAAVLVFGALFVLANPDLVTSHLADPVLKEEACLAAVAIAEKLVPRHKAEVAAAMKQVIQATANEKLAAKAKGLANQAKP